MAKARFELGQTVATPGALEAFMRSGDTPLPYLTEHANRNWGEVDQHDKAHSEVAIERGFRILSAYRLADDTTIWIITEADRSVTTVLLPEEY